MFKINSFNNYNCIIYYLGIAYMHGKYLMLILKHFKFIFLKKIKRLKKKQI